MTISPDLFLSALLPEDEGFVAGVPDSLLQGFCAHVAATLPAERHVIAVNEGAAVALAVGAWIATGAVPLVYLQNSGLGNAVNPLLSLADPQVSAVPMILLVGWRGRPGRPDEPQHLPQGRSTAAMLDVVGIPWRGVSGNPEMALAAAQWARANAVARQGPVALLVHEGAFAKVAAPPVAPGLMRAEAIRLVLERRHGPIVAATGMIGRELLALRLRRGEAEGHDLLNVGAMGHTAQIALGLALARTGVDVTCLDGDGGALMHLGALAGIGAAPRGDLLHVVLNNGAHDSVGGQPTVAQQISLTGIARACGYAAVAGPVSDAEGLVAALDDLGAQPGRRFLEITVARGAAPGLPRPERPPAETTRRFAAGLRDR